MTPHRHSRHDHGDLHLETLSGLPAVLSDGARDCLTGPTGDVIEQTDVLGKPSTGGTVYLHADRLGSTRLLTNTNGQAVGSYTYTPTGTRIQNDGLALLPYAQGIPPKQADTAFGYAGAYTDPGAGFFYLQHRYYDPTTDQFLTLDPALNLTGQPYSYAADDPVDITDPEGAFCVSWHCIKHDVSHVVHNPVFQAVVTISACSFGGPAGCIAANVAFDALNAYDRYQKDGGLTWGFVLGTATDVAASFGDIKSLKALEGADVGLSFRRNAPALLKTTIRKVPDIPLSVALPQLGRNVLLGSSYALADYGAQWVLGETAFGKQPVLCHK